MAPRSSLSQPIVQGRVGAEGGFLSVHGLVRTFGAVRALDGVSLTLRRGEIRALAGENGCGKSTLIKVLAGVLAPNAGEIRLDGVAHRRLRPLEAMRSGIQVIYQDFALFPNLSVAENLALPGEISQRRGWIRPHLRRQQAAEALAQIGISLDPDQRVSDLSVARQQLVAIARALGQHARLLILDEPTTALTHREVQALFGLIRGLRDAGVSILLVSHKIREVLEIADAVTVMRNGRVVTEGAGADFDAARLASALTGRELGKAVLGSSTMGKVASDTPPRLEIVGLSSGNAVRSVNLRLAAGEILGLAGLLGAGRTALATALFGLRPIDAGHVRVDGRLRVLATPSDAMAAGLAYVPEDRLAEGLFLRESIERNLAAAVLPTLRGALPGLNLRRLRQLAIDEVEKYGVRTTSVMAPVDTLSGGNQQKVLLARWLATNARVMILNRPTAGVDVGARADIHAQVRALADAGLAVLVISDELSELAALSHRVAVMHAGEFVGELAGDAVTETALAAWLDRLA